MASRFVAPFFDAGSGIKPSDGSQLFFYETGTSTPKDTYTDSAATTPNANPVIADSTGVFSDIFITGTYKVVLKDKNDVQTWEADPVDEFAKVVDGSIVNSTETVSSLKSTNYVIGTTVFTQGYFAAGDGGHASYLIAATQAVDEYGEHTLDNGNVALLQTDGKVDIRVFGCIDSVTDQQPQSQAAIDYAAANDLVLTGSHMTIGILPVVPSGSNGLNWVEGFRGEFDNLELKLLGSTYNGAFISSPLVDPGTDNTSVRTDDVHVSGLILDCNGILGENGTGAYGDDIVFEDFTYKNVRQSDIKAGGKGSQMEGLSRKGIKIIRPTFIDCDIGISQQAADNDTIHNITDVLYTNVVMRNVGIPVLTVNTFSTTLDHEGDTRKFGLFIDGMTCYNCGRPEWNTTSGGSTGMEEEGAILVSDRGFGTRIDAVRVINEDSYGAIGSLSRGSMFNMQLNDWDVSALKVNAIHNFSPVIDGVLNGGGSVLDYVNTLKTNNIDTTKTDIGILVEDKVGNDLGNVDLGFTIDTDKAVSLDLVSAAGLVSTNYTINTRGSITLQDLRATETRFVMRKISVLKFSSFDDVSYPVTMEAGAFSSSTANGKFLQFPDGTMIQNHSIETTTSINTVWGTLFTGTISTVDYPIAFVGDLPAVSAWVEGTSSQLLFGNTGTAGTLTKPGNFLLARAVTLASGTFKVHYIARGRWK